MTGPRLLLLFAALLLGVGLLWLGVPRTAARAPDAPPAGLAPRTLALLAFHEAQDAGDVARMLLVADRLERLGERGLAAHVRHVARELAREAARAPADSPATGRFPPSAGGHRAPGSP